MANMPNLVADREQWILSNIFLRSVVYRSRKFGKKSTKDDPYDDIKETMSQCTDGTLFSLLRICCGRFQCLLHTPHWEKLRLTCIFEPRRVCPEGDARLAHRICARFISSGLEKLFFRACGRQNTLQYPSQG